MSRTIERIYIVEGERKHTELVIYTPKTKNSCREIPMSKELLAIVKPLKKVVNQDYYVLITCNHQLSQAGLTIGNERIVR